MCKYNTTLQGNILYSLPDHHLSSVYYQPAINQLRDVKAIVSLQLLRDLPRKCTVPKGDDGTRLFCFLQRRACQRSRTTLATCGRKVEAWRTSSPPRRSRWCGHLRVSGHRRNAAKRQNDDPESSVLVKRRD